MTDEESAKLLENLRNYITRICRENDYPIPDFTKEEDYYIPNPKVYGKWEQIYRCSNCGCIFENENGWGYLPDECPKCRAKMMQYGGSMVCEYE